MIWLMRLGGTRICRESSVGLTPSSSSSSARTSPGWIGVGPWSKFSVVVHDLDVGRACLCVGPFDARAVIRIALDLSKTKGPAISRQALEVFGRPCRDRTYDQRIKSFKYRRFLACIGPPSPVDARRSPPSLSRFCHGPGNACRTRVLRTSTSALRCSETASLRARTFKRCLQATNFCHSSWYLVRIKSLFLRRGQANSRAV